MGDFGVTVQRWVLVGLMPLMAVVFWSGTSDPVNVPKVSLAALAALLLVSLSLIRLAVQRHLTVPLTPSLWVVTVFGVLMLVATAVSDVPGASFAGSHGRSAGLLLYGSCVMLFLHGLRLLDSERARWLIWGVLVGGAFAATYGLLQKAGQDPIHWSASGSPIIGTFGNPDFESGYLGIVTPAAAWGVITQTWGSAWRVSSGALLAACLAGALLSSAVQGVLAGAAGLLVVAVALLLNRGSIAARRAVIGLAITSIALAGVVIVGVVAGIGPGARLTGAGAVTARRWYWSTAFRMWRHHPLFGVGPDRYGAYFRAFRPEAAANASNYSDAAHNVPLQLLATGGLLTAAMYLLFVGLVGWALLRALWRLTGEARLLAAGLGGAWLAYQIQSLVSIDQPGLAVTHWLLGAAVIVLGAPFRTYERHLPGAVIPKARRGRPATQSQPALVWSGVNVTAGAVIVALALVGGWNLLRPLRADHAARVAAVALADGDGNVAFAHLNTATRLAPSEQTYWLQRGRFLDQVKQPQLAAQDYAIGVRHDPRSYDVLLAGAVLAKAQNDVAALDRYTQQLAAVDPSGRWRTSLEG